MRRIIDPFGRVGSMPANAAIVTEVLLVSISLFSVHIVRFTCCIMLFFHLMSLMTLLGLSSSQ